MATVIKSTDVERASQATTFNFDDMNRQAERYVAEVQVRVRKAVDQAQREAQAIRQRAEQEGKAAAMRDIERLVEQRVAERIATVTPPLAEAARLLQQAREDWLAHWERSAVKLATAIAERVVRRELTRQPEITLDLVREALRLAGGHAQVRLALNPTDFQALGQQAERLCAEVSPAAPAQVVADAQVTPGGCRVDTQHGVVDQQIETQLARITEELT